MEDNFSLDTFVKENGQQITEDSIKTISKEVIEKKINNFIYEDSDTPIPGQSIDNKLTDQLDNMNETTALDSLITKAALVKAKNESKRKKLTMKERNQYKKQFIESMMYQHGEAYYQKKDKIRENMKSSLSDIELLTKTRERATVCLPFPSARVFRTVPTPQSPPSCSIRRIKRCTSPNEKAKRDVRSTQQK